MCDDFSSNSFSLIILKKNDSTGLFESFTGLFDYGTSIDSTTKIISYNFTFNFNQVGTF